MAVRVGAFAVAPPRGPWRSAPRRSRSGATPLLLLPLAFLGVFLVTPLVFVLTTALSDHGLRGIAAAVSDPVFPSALRRTFLIAAGVTGTTVVVGTVYALGLVLARGWLRALLIGTLLASFWISLLVRTLGWVLLFEPAGALDSALHVLGLLHHPLSLLQTTVGMYPAMIHIMLPYMVLPIWAAFGGLDERQIHAARGLGATPPLILRHVVLPQVRTGIVAGVVLVFALSLGFYVTPAFLGGPGDLTIGTLVGQEFSTSAAGSFVAPSAIGLLLVLAVIALYLVADRMLGVSERWSAPGRAAPAAT
ncbi:MAG TPA: ABC transporter permease [Candidatus Sulfotelmatobacter sp.]|nr:ABC transporter permease [Candidatus Sulfotelmatobacter sp.]